MKPGRFAYHAPRELDEALAMLHEYGDEAKVLAGGQSLMPMLNFRLAQIEHLVDINRLQADLTEVGWAADTLVIPALVRQRHVELSERVAQRLPVLAQALRQVAHPQIRNRGTVCGSLAHADPGAELPAVASCLGATLEIAGPAGRRTVPAAEFFVGVMTTTVGPEEIVVAVNFPVAGTGEGFGFAEIARRHGDFALAGVVTRVRSAQGQVLDATVTGFGVSDRPITRDVTGFVASAAEQTDSAGALRAGTDALAAEVVDTVGDGHGSRGYRRRLFAVLAARELARALRGSRGVES
jgi:carbon-monoxide dehydrogenase medium subunit